MPKQKTHKGLAKRVKVTAKGKLKHRHAGGSHLMSSKSPKRRRRISSPAVSVTAIAKTMKTMLCAK